MHPRRKVVPSTGTPSLRQGSQQRQHRLDHRSHSRMRRQAWDQQEQIVRGGLQTCSLRMARQREVTAPPW